LWKFSIFLLQNQFLVLVALTPKKFLNPLRIALQEVSIDSLKKIEYDNFKAIILGDDEKVEGNLIYVKSPDGTKGKRLTVALKYILDQKIDFDYIARFDDDDVFNPKVLQQFSSIEADCLADHFHAFYDLNSNRTISTKKNWLANTAFLTREHAFSIQKDGRTLIEQDHAEEWHLYFEKRNMYYASAGQPIYLRVLSPTSITANGQEGSSYSHYLQSFGDWSQPLKLTNFSESLSKLEKVHQEFYPEGKYEPLKTNVIQKVKKRVKKILGKA
jgi:hypothetical protein